MNYRQFMPCEQLKPYVKFFWIFESEEVGEEKCFQVIPDGLPGMIIQQKKSFKNNSGHFLPQAFLYGQTTKYSQQIVNEKFKTLGIYFRPQALKSIFGFDAQELTGLEVDINNIMSMNDILTPLYDSQDDHDRISILSDYLKACLSRNETWGSDPVHLIIDQITACKGVINFSDIHKQHFISKRTFERRFKQHVGVTAKFFARLTRFQFALDMIRSGNLIDFSNIAYDLCYADQSHFIRDFKEFTGSTPSRFLQNRKESVINYPELLP